MRCIVVGVGNRFRRDDGVGLRLLNVLEEDFAIEGVDFRESSGELTELHEIFSSYESVILIDALHDEVRPAGELVRLEGPQITKLVAGTSSSTHGLGVAQALQMTEALGTGPKRIVLYGIVGKDFDFGPDLSSDLEKSLPRIAESIRQENWKCTKPL